ncbi:hypothetical protein NDA11_002624 [Ustilago hordei]|nr:hypothetical protein NDA11_002624 [Ustilago hordei]
MPQHSFLAPPQPPASEVVRYQDHIGSPSRSEKTIQRILSQSTRIHILHDKLDRQLAKELELRAQKLGAQVTSSPDAANVVITVLKAPKRVAKHFRDADLNVFPAKRERVAEEGEGGQLERKLGDGVGRDWRRFVVTPDWLEQVEREGGLVDPDLFHAVILRPQTSCTTSNVGDSTTRNDTNLVGGKRKRSPSDSPLLPTSHGTKQPRPSLSHPSSSSSSSSSSGSPFPTPTKEEIPAGYYDPILPAFPCPPWQNTRFACRRPSPLFSPNQPLIAELEQIRTERRLTGDTYSEMAYMRAISALKAYPFRIPDPLLDPAGIYDRQLLEMRLGEVEKLKGVGKKVFSLIKQFYSLPAGLGEEEKRNRVEEGRIIEAKVIKRDRAVYVMNSFTELYGIGPIGAREAYNSGARSFADVLDRGKSLATHLSARESVRILSDLRKPIGREECRSITAHIMDLVRSVLGDGVQVKHEICGGYRRGKTQTYDLDIIIGHAQPRSRALHLRLLNEMKGKGLLTHMVNISTPAATLDSDLHPAGAKEAVHIDIANIVVLPPLSGTNPNPVHRRVDLVFCPLKVYGATILGWTGSVTFERDLRLWAKQKGYSFNFDGLTHLGVAEEAGLVETQDESEVFDALGLQWMPPEWRNCDA